MCARFRGSTLGLVAVFLTGLCGSGSGDEAPGAAAAHSGHPRLLFGPGDVPALRLKAHSEGIAGEAMQRLLADAAGFAQLDTAGYVLHGAVAGRAFSKQVVTLAPAGAPPGAAGGMRSG